MTTILFKDNKFWIDGVEIINPELLIYFDVTLFEGHTHRLPENLSYEVINRVTATKSYPKDIEQVIRLKLKDDREDYPITDYAMKNETPEAVVEKPDKKKKCQHKGIHNSTCVYTKDTTKPSLNMEINNLKNQLKDLNIAAEFEINELQKSNELLNEKISDLEAQLVKAKELLLSANEFIPFYHFELKQEIESFISTNEPGSNKV